MAPGMAFSHITSKTGVSKSANNPLLGKSNHFSPANGKHIRQSSLSVFGINCMDTTASILPNLLLATDGGIGDPGMMTKDGFEPQIYMEPQLNVPAFVSFLFIFVIYFPLIRRVGEINDAAEQRMITLKNLRTMKSKELSNKASAEDVLKALNDYEESLVNEEKLRTILPGVRIRAPNNPNQSEEDIAAVRQFFGNESNLLTPPGEQEKESTVSPVALTFLWIIVGGTQLALLIFLLMDDTAVNGLFNSFGPAVTDPSSIAETVGDIMSLE